MTTAARVRETDNPYLTGNFAPVREEITAIDLDVTGSIPEYLDGRYLRIGPNPMGDPDPAKYHWFLGTGMAHGLRLRDGKALWYRNRYVRSADVARRLGETWPGGAHSGGVDFAANTNIIGHAGRTYAIAESGVRPYELTDELETVGPSDFCGTLFGGYTAHPKRDPATGELHAVSYNPMRGNIVQYTVTGVDGKVRRTVNIRLKAQTMMHDFSLTEKYVVLYDLPVALDLSGVLHGRPAKAVAGMLTRIAERHAAPDFVVRAIMRGSERSGPPSGGMPYRWAPERQARVGVMPREGTASDIRWFEVKPCYVFHPLNAYDDGDRIVLDVVRHSSVFTTGTRLFPEDQSLDRWTVDLTSAKVIEERLDDTPQEFPRVDERLVGRRHRYGYSVGYSRESDGYSRQDAILKHDLSTHSSQSVAFGPGREPGEFVFVPSTADAAEDDGVAMGFVYDRSADRSDLVLLDGQTLETVATVHLPARVPHGFHGNWVPTEGLGPQ
ncbi:carotenoid oxygenase family protein [Mycobacterium sp.]|uniref:carotenoid oxygenase family protein n=1 Tax=Mycobacterium sp. TaxID=1785 RepID=UPI002DB2A4C3|nr:carotenoid oxygenase family protein [Mycobacterium sp.]